MASFMAERLRQYRLRSRLRSHISPLEQAAKRRREKNQPIQLPVEQSVIPSAPEIIKLFDFDISKTDLAEITNVLLPPIPKQDVSELSRDKNS